MSYVGVITKNGESFQNSTIRLISNATLQCDAPGVQALADSWSTCWAFQLPFLLEFIQIGYINIVLATVIILISIYSGIKENYKWFILVQALWDLLISYDFICDKPTGQFFAKSDPEVAAKLWNQGPATCFYSTNTVSPAWPFFFMKAIKFAVRFISFPQVLVLSFSRVIAMFASSFYGRHSSTLKVCVTLLIVNVISLLVINFDPIFNHLNHLTALAYCNCWNCTVTNPCVYAFFTDSNRTYLLLGIAPSFALICLLLTAISIISVLVRILWQFKYQYLHNKKSLITSIRITVVLFFQFSMAFLCFLLIFFGEFLNFWTLNVVSKLFPNSMAAVSEIQKITPPWVKRLQLTPQCLNMLRSFVDSIIVLTVLTGYRKGVMKLVYLAVHPKKAFYTKSQSTSSGVLFLDSRV